MWSVHLLMTLPMFLLLAGCGSDRPDTIHVSGRITFDGQPPPGAGMLYITAEQAVEGYPLRPASARFDASGYFEVTTWDAGDGMIPGSYRVAVECWQTPPTIGGPPAVSYVPRQYQTPNSSGLTIEVAPDDSSRELNIDLQS